MKKNILMNNKTTHANTEKNSSEQEWLPLVSIVTPSYNQGRFIQRTIDSVLNQTYKNIEYIIIDGDSTDNTKEILQSYGDKFYWISEPDRGQTHAINKGFAMAKGEIFAYLNSDDMIHASAVEKIVACFKKQPEADMIYGDADIVDENDKFIRRYQIAPYSFSRLMQDCCICQPAAFWRKKIADVVGPFNEKLNYAMDYEYWLRIDRADGQIVYYPQKLAWSREHAETKTLSARGKIYKEIFKVCKMHGGYVSRNYYHVRWHYRFYEKFYSLKKIARYIPFKEAILTQCNTVARAHYFLSSNNNHSFLEKIKIVFKFLYKRLSLNLLLKLLFKPLTLLYKKIKQNFNSQLIIPTGNTAKDLLIPKHYYHKKRMANYPTISIVTPSYNQAHYIERTIKSVLTQEYPSIEYIIQDGKSKDNTVEVLKKYQRQLKHWESKADAGQAHAINLGFQHGTGEIMAYLNSDDLLLPNTLHYVASYFEKHPEVDVVYGHRILINENDLEIGRWVLPPHYNKITEWVDFVPQETLFWRRCIWDKVGAKIDESFQFAMDWDLIIRFQQAGAKIKRLPRFLGAFRVHQQQKTIASMADSGIKEMGKIRESIHKRPLSDFEIQQQIKSYILKHSFYHKLYLFKHFFAKKKVFIA